MAEQTWEIGDFRSDINGNLDNLAQMKKRFLEIDEKLMSLTEEGLLDNMENISQSDVDLTTESLKELVEQEFNINEKKAEDFTMDDCNINTTQYDSVKNTIHISTNDRNNDSQTVIADAKYNDLQQESDNDETSSFIQFKNEDVQVENINKGNKITGTVSFSDEDRLILYEKGLTLKRIGNIGHALLCFLDCLRGLQPSSKSKFTILPQCLTHIAQIYAQYEDYQRAVEFMQATKLYYEIAIIEAGVKVDKYKKETDSSYRPLDLDPCLDEAKRANEYEKLSYSCLERQKFQLSLDYCGKATKLRQQVYGDEHPVTSKSLDLFTLIYAEMGKCQYNEALQKHQQHPETLKQKDEKENVQESGSKETDEEIKLNLSPQVIPVKHETSMAEERTRQVNANVFNTTKKADSSEPIDNTEEDTDTSLITAKQLLVIFIVSAIISVLLTGVWCYLFESDMCPSRYHLHQSMKDLYESYFSSSRIVTIHHLKEE